MYNCIQYLYTDDDDGEHHVVVVDQKDELFLALRELRRHSQYEVLHFIE